MVTAPVQERLTKQKVTCLRLWTTSQTMSRDGCSTRCSTPGVNGCVMAVQTALSTALSTARTCAMVKYPCRAVASTLPTLEVGTTQTAHHMDHITGLFQGRLVSIGQLCESYYVTDTS